MEPFKTRVQTLVQNTLKGDFTAFSTDAKSVLDEIYRTHTEKEFKEMTYTLRDQCREALDQIGTAALQSKNADEYVALRNARAHLIALDNWRKDAEEGFEKDVSKAHMSYDESKENKPVPRDGENPLEIKAPESVNITRPDGWATYLEAWKAAKDNLQAALDAFQKNDGEGFAKHWVEKEFHFYKADAASSKVGRAMQSHALKKEIHYDILPEHIFDEGNLPAVVKAWTNDKDPSLQLMLREWKGKTPRGIKKVYFVKEGDQFKIKSW